MSAPPRLLAALGFVLILSDPANAATIRVPSEQPTIQAGIDAAAAGDTVLVAPGTYTGLGNKDLDFGGVDLVLRSEAGPAQTIIDCEGTGRGFYFHRGETISRVEGFTIQRGSASGAYCSGSWDAPVAVVFAECNFVENAGGGVDAFECDLIVVDCDFIRNTGSGLRCFGYSRTLSLTRCTFRGNQSSLGGALYTSMVTVQVQDCVFEENTAIEGGGVLWDGGGPSPAGGSASGELSVFRGCVFRDNTASGWGGGIRISGTPLRIELDSCIFVGNTAARGGGMSVIISGPLLRRCTFYGNGAPLGGGIYLDQFAGAEVHNSIIAFSTQGEAVVKRSFGSSCAGLTCCDLYGNAGGDWVDCVADQQLVNGNQNADPLFCDAPNSDLHLASSSPCAPENSPTGCDLIGALPVGCGVTSVPEILLEPTTWGAIKATYR